MLVVLFLGPQLGTFQKSDLMEMKLMRLMAGQTEVLGEWNAGSHASSWR